MKYSEIISEISKRGGVELKEVEKRVNEKIRELSGLITKEGAAMLVAREFGLSLFKKADLKIKDIDFGMKNFNVRGRIFRLSKIVEFERSNGEKGKVVNIYISDGTGFLRIPLWNDQTKIVEDNIVKVGDTIQVINAIARENIFGDLEISLGKYGKIIKIEDESIPSLEDIEKMIEEEKNKRIEIGRLERGFYEIVGTVVHVFKGSFVYSVCPLGVSRLV